MSVFWLSSPHRAERSQRDLSALWASRRASAQAVTSKWHFRTTSRKMDRSGAVFSSIRMISRGKTTDAADNSIFPAARPKRAVFRAPGDRNGYITFGISPRRSDAPGKLSAPKLPFSHINIGSLKKKRDSGPFRGTSGRNAFRETAENGRRPLGKTALPGRLCTNLKNPKG